MRNTESFSFMLTTGNKVGGNHVTHVCVREYPMASAVVVKTHLRQKRSRKILRSRLAKRLGRGVESEQKLTTSALSVEENREWLDLGTPGPVCRALSEMGFHSPTDIQRETIPVVIQGKKDVVGAAETVSFASLFVR